MAQTSLRGKVVAAETGQAIEGAKVTLANQNISTTTNPSGEFALIYLEAMDEEVIFEAEGYVSDIQLVELTEGQTNDMGAVSLQTNIQQEMQDEILLSLSDADLNDDEGKSQSMSSGSSASVDVFNNTTSYAQYWSEIHGRIYFHSTLYNSLKAHDYSANSWNNMGNAVSHGCVRLTVPETAATVWAAVVAADWATVVMLVSSWVLVPCFFSSSSMISFTFSVMALLVLGT